jgi:hypothetical protein
MASTFFPRRVRRSTSVKPATYADGFESTGTLRLLQTKRRSHSTSHAPITRPADPLNLKQTRQALEKDPAFATLFTEARKRVSAMEVRFIEIPDDDWELSTVFEVYAAVALGTSKYNSFRPH